MNYLKLIYIMISFLIKSPFCFRMFSQVVKSTKYISFKDGPPSAMHVSERQIKCGQDQLLIKVKAIGLNRAQCLQRAGKYAAQKQVQKYLGLQASGQVYDPNQLQKKLFDGMALLSGGSYGQWVTVPKQHIMKIPTNLSFIQGAAIPQAWLTAFQIIRFADLKQGQSLVIYAGASGVGTAAIQICKYLKFKAFAVCSTPQKGKICKQVGATGVAYYKDNQKWEEDLIKQNDGKHFEAVLDCVGSSNVNQTLKLIKVDGKWVLYGLLSGGKTELNLASLLGKRINLISTTLKSRSKEYKSQLIEDFKNRVVPGFEQGKLKPIIHCTIDCDWKSEKAFVEGHEIMQNNQNAGKIIINYL